MNIKLLNHSLKKKNLAHAFLFNGSNTDGLLKIALLFACSILCKNDGCLECRDCKNILNLKHPDLFLLKPSGTSYFALLSEPRPYVFIHLKPGEKAHNLTKIS